MEKTKPVITALTIYCDCNLGRLSYTKQGVYLQQLIFPFFHHGQDLESSKEVSHHQY